MVTNTKETAPREFYIKKKDVEAHGHTKGCHGCREKFQHLMNNEENVSRTQGKRKEDEEKMEEETRRLETKKQRKEENRRFATRIQDVAA